MASSANIAYDIAERVRGLNRRTWARKIMHQTTVRDNDASVRKASNVEAFAVDQDGESVITIPGGSRLCTPAIYSIPCTQGMEQSDFHQKKIDQAMDNLANLIYRETSIIEDANLSNVLDACTKKTDQLVNARVVITFQDIFNAIQLVEKTGSAARFISMARIDFEMMVNDTPNQPGFVQESDRFEYEAGALGDYIGVSIVSCPRDAKEMIPAGTVYVTVAPEVLGQLGIRQDLEVSDFMVEEGKRGWLWNTTERMVVTNPYGVSRVVLKRSKRTA